MPSDTDTLAIRMIVYLTKSYYIILIKSLSIFIVYIIPDFGCLHLLPTFQRNLHRPWALMGLSHGLATLQRGYDPPRFAPIQRKIREGTPRGLQFGSFCMEGL